MPQLLSYLGGMAAGGLLILLVCWLSGTFRISFHRGLPPLVPDIVEGTGPCTLHDRQILWDGFALGMSELQRGSADGQQLVCLIHGGTNELLVAIPRGGVLRLVSGLLHVSREALDYDEDVQQQLSLAEDYVDAAREQLRVETGDGS